jgi:hypothetical protein
VAEAFRKDGFDSKTATINTEEGAGTFIPSLKMDMLTKLLS